MVLPMFCMRPNWLSVRLPASQSLKAIRITSVQSRSTILKPIKRNGEGFLLYNFKSTPAFPKTQADVYVLGLDRREDYCGCDIIVRKRKRRIYRTGPTGPTSVNLHFSCGILYKTKETGSVKMPKPGV